MGKFQYHNPPKTNVFPCYLHSYQELPTALLPVMFTVIFIGVIIPFLWGYNLQLTYNWYFGPFLAQQSDL